MFASLARACHQVVELITYITCYITCVNTYSYRSDLLPIYLGLCMTYLRGQLLVLGFVELWVFQACGHRSGDDHGASLHGRCSVGRAVCGIMPVRSVWGMVGDVSMCWPQRGTLCWCVVLHQASTLMARCCCGAHVHGAALHCHHTLHGATLLCGTQCGTLFQVIRHGPIVQFGAFTFQLHCQNQRPHRCAISKCAALNMTYDVRQCLQLKGAT
jgi:hypothetical protein